MADPNLTVLVLNLSPRVTVAQLTAFFSYCGYVEKIQFLGPACENKGRCQSALVTFRQPYAYQTALLLNDANFAGQPIRVLPKKDVSSYPSLHQLPIVADQNNRFQGNIPVLGDAVQVMASDGIERLNQRRDELDEKYKLSEKSRVLMHKTRSAVFAADQAVSAAEQAARDVATRIMNTDYVAIGANWLSGVLDKTSKLVSEIGTRKCHSPYCRNINVAAELHALRHGLALASVRGYRMVVCESDAKVVLDLISSCDHACHGLGNLIIDVRELRDRDWTCILQHTSYEDNFVADGLSTMGL